MADKAAKYAISNSIASEVQLFAKKDAKLLIKLDCTNM